jgi:deoxyadenosine/deoxycytidine kinase
LLTPFYKEPEKYAVPLQEQILTSYFETWKKHEESKEIIFLEACGLSSYEVFGKMLKDDGVINKDGFELVQSYAEKFNILTELPQLFLYLDVEPIVSLTRYFIIKCRIKGRGREGEDSIQLGYLNRLDDYYSDFMGKYKDQFEIVKLSNNKEDQTKEIAQSIHELCQQKLNKL